MTRSTARTIVRVLLWSAWLATMTGLLYATFVVGKLAEAVRYGVP